MSDADAVPTFGRVVRDLAALGRDRGALICEAQPWMESGIWVIMNSVAAVRDLGPLTIEAVKRFGDPNAPKQMEYMLSDESRVAEVFLYMEANKHLWLWAGTIERPPLNSIFYGQEVCEWLAPLLTERDCPCHLT